VSERTARAEVEAAYTQCTSAELPDGRACHAKALYEKATLLRAFGKNLMQVLRDLSLADTVKIEIVDEQQQTQGSFKREDESWPLALTRHS
jgi:hypothetical protein